MEFLRSYKTSVVAVIAVLVGIASKLFPGMETMVGDVQVFLIAILAFLTKDADKV